MDLEADWSYDREPEMMKSRLELKIMCEKQEKNINA